MKPTVKQYAQSLFEVTKEKDESETRKAIKKLAEIIARNNDANKKEKVISEFGKIWNKENNIMEVEISSKRNLSEEEKENLSHYIVKLCGAKEIIVKQKVDKNILGGLIIKYGDKILDASLRTVVGELKKSIVKA
jgi:F-type H+-transporting ATPase subunit delta